VHKTIFTGLVALLALGAWVGEALGAEPGTQAQTGCHTVEKLVYTWSVSISPGEEVTPFAAVYEDNQVRILVAVPIRGP